jgi:hypothetical protein
MRPPAPSLQSQIVQLPWNEWMSVHSRPLSGSRCAVLDMPMLHVALGSSKRRTLPVRVSPAATTIAAPPSLRSVPRSIQNA